MASAVRLTDGSFSFEGGIDSGRVTTIQSAANPYGLARNQLAWGNNITVRGGGISPRYGWNKLASLAAGIGLFQGAIIYEPIDGTNPYAVASVNGHILKMLVDAPYTVTDLSAQFKLFNPPGAPKAFFCQGEQFLVIQAGDFNPATNTGTLPLFWDGVKLRRSAGLVDPHPPPPSSPPVTYHLTNVANWTIPPVGNSVTVMLNAPYPGSIGDVISWDVVGQFLVITGTSGNNLVLQTINSGYIGGTLGQFTWTVVTVPPPVTPSTFVAELPSATCMVYYQGRVWYAQGNQYIAGDIVRGPSGTLAYANTDSILKVTENPLAIGGDGFSVPSNAGTINALAYTSNLDTTLGQGQLYIFTDKQVFALTVPVTRTAWIAATAQNQPIQTVAQIGFGGVGDRSVTHVNGDLFYQSIEPAVRTLIVSTRLFGSWANLPISKNINRALQFSTLPGLDWASGINFDNRLLQTILPIQTPVGYAFQAIAAMDFDIISSFGDANSNPLAPVPKPPPVWESVLEGLQVLQLLDSDQFATNTSRGFAVVLSETQGDIEIWELSSSNLNTATRTDNNGLTRIGWFFETPAFTWGKEMELKTLDGAEIWLDQIYGTVEMDFYYRPDALSCWQFWDHREFCSAANSCEDVTNPVCYPLTPLGPGEKFPIKLRQPDPAPCNAQDLRPYNVGYQFQMKVVVKGWCRVRGLLLQAIPTMDTPFGEC